MSTKAQELNGGCFNAALEDEPMFVLLARDPSAPDLVRDWARKREANIQVGMRSDSDTPKVIEARQLADSMERWRVENDGAWRKV